MDKQLKNVKDEFNQIPTSFTDEDKQAIRFKIDQNESKPKRKVLHFYPKLLTVAVLASAILIFIVTINNQPNLFITSNDSADRSMEMTVDQDFGEEESGAFEAEISSSEDGLDNSVVNDGYVNIFTPDSIQHNSNFPVSNVEKHGAETIITFDGYQLTGSFINDDPLSFEPNEDSWRQIPIAEGDVDKDIPIYISNEQFVRSTFEIGNEENTEISILVYELEYHYSPDGSSIYLKVADHSGMAGITIDTHTESIVLSDNLRNRYEQYKTSLDDYDLKGLTAFDIFKLYHYANYQGDLEVQHALYFDKENHYVPDKDTFLAEANYSEQQAEETYSALLSVEQFEEIYRTENEAIIRYTLENPMGFNLYRDKELDVWKVSWMPIQ